MECSMGCSCHLAGVKRASFLLVAVGVIVIAFVGASAQPAPLPGGIRICHVFSPSGPLAIPLNIIIPEADLPIHLAHGDVYPVPAGGCRTLLTTTTTTTTSTTTTALPTTTTTVPSSSILSTTTTTTTRPPEACPTVPTTVPMPGGETTVVASAISGELPVTGAGPRPMGAVAVVLLVAGMAITALRKCDHVASDPRAGTTE
jgi:hypothetical protein